MTASLELEYGVHAGEVELEVLDVDDVELEVLDDVLDDVLEVVDDREVIILELMVGLHEQAEL